MTGIMGYSISMLPRKKRHQDEIKQDCYLITVLYGVIMHACSTNFDSDSVKLWRQS